MKIIGLPYPSTFDNISLKPPAGISLKVALQGNQPQARDFFFEHETSCSLIHNDWKLVRRDGLKSWEPYNIKNDPFEQLDLASKKYRDPNQPKKIWDTWAELNNVLKLESRPWGNRTKHYTGLNPDQFR